MEATFPFGLPPATAFYLALYVLTFAVHHAFMHYVAAGSLYVAWSVLWNTGDEHVATPQSNTDTLRDWMPFFLSAAITAGVAPLLFVQIVYPQNFYTANLLLWGRWLIVIPVLIIGFYLLYVVKSRSLRKWPLVIRGAVVISPAVCFLFVGFCWTANHLVSANPASWTEVYSTGRIGISIAAVVLRTLIWLGGAFGSLAVILTWQRGRPASVPFETPQQQHQTALPLLAVCGIITSLIAGIAYLWQMQTDARQLLLGSFALPYLILACVGAIVQAGGWAWVWRKSVGQVSSGLRLMLTLAWVLTLISVAVLRESVRLGSVDITALFAQHAAALKVGGFGVFVVLTVINTALIAGCILLVRRNLRSTPEDVPAEVPANAPAE